MQRTKKITAFVLAIALCVGMLQTLGVNAKAADTGKHMDVLFTHDTHSHLNSFSTIVDGKQEEVGGFARLKTLIDEQKEKNPDTLYLDGGDFSMGTLIQTVYETEAAELRMLGYLGCDVTTWGNHEFDYRSSGLANMLNTAKASGENVPSLVVCNVDWSAMEKAGLTEGQQQIKDAFENYGVKDYVVVQKGDVKIAVFGVFGKDSLDCAPTCELLFEDPIEASKKTVEEIKKNEDVDMIACVSHSGTVEDEDKSEDEILAKNVPDIDLIISGHTHTQLDEPIQHGDTYIVSCGEYGRNLGTISMTQKDDGDTDYYDYDDYDDDDDDDYYDDDYDDYDYNSNGRDSKKEKRNDKQDPDSKKSKKKKRCGLPNVGKPVANIAKTGINATKKLVGTILRAATLILIALIILTLLKAFLSNAGSYGKILLLGQTKDTTLIAYLAVGAVLVGYELLNFFWAASRTRARSRHNNRLDTGRGLLSFVIIYAGSYLAAMFSHLIPSSPSWLTGVQGGLSIYGGLKATLLPLCIAGVVSCVVRKIIVR